MRVGQSGEAEARVESGDHSDGSRHLKSPPTMCHNALFAKGLQARVRFSVPHSCLKCM